MIKVENLTKWFGTKLAVDDVSFSVEKGEILGFLGPNGAGKSTTMRMITGFYPPDKGSVSLGGFDIEKDPVAAKLMMGYLPENAPAYGDMTVQGFLKFVASLRAMTGLSLAKAVEEVIETCFLQSVRHQPIETLSKGYLHRTCFAQSIIHDPEILILDEPTDGLDPNQKHEVRNLIKRMGERKAIVLSTHILEEVDAVCTRVIIINQGKLVANGVPAELKARSKLAASVTLSVTGQAYTEIAAKLEQLDVVDSLVCLNESDGVCNVRALPSDDVKGDDLSAQVFGVAVTEGWKLTELHLNEGRLDDVFRDITTSDVDQG